MAMTIHSFGFTLKANATPADVRDALKAEVNRRLSSLADQDYLATTKVRQAERRGQMNALSGVLHILDNLEFV